MATASMHLCSIRCFRASKGCTRHGFPLPCVSEAGSRERASRSRGVAQSLVPIAHAAGSRHGLTRRHLGCGCCRAGQAPRVESDLAPHGRPSQPSLSVLKSLGTNLTSSDLGRLLHEFGDALGEFRVLLSGCGDLIVGFHSQSFFFHSTSHFGIGLGLQLLDFVGIARLLQAG